MDLRVFFYRRFVGEQGREKGIAREFLEKNEKNGDPFLRMCRGRAGGEKALALSYRECRGGARPARDHILE